MTGKNEVTPYQLNKESQKGTGTNFVRDNDSDALALMKIAEMVVSQNKTSDLIANEVQLEKPLLLQGVKEALGIPEEETDDSAVGNLTPVNPSSDVESSDVSENESATEDSTFGSSDVEDVSPKEPVAFLIKALDEEREQNKELEALNLELQGLVFELNQDVEKKERSCQTEKSDNFRLRQENSDLTKTFKAVFEALDNDQPRLEDIVEKTQPLEDILAKAKQLKEDNTTLRKDLESIGDTIFREFNFTNDDVTAAVAQLIGFYTDVRGKLFPDTENPSVDKIFEKFERVVAEHTGDGQTASSVSSSSESSSESEGNVSKDENDSLSLSTSSSSGGESSSPADSEQDIPSNTSSSEESDDDNYDPIAQYVKQLEKTNASDLDARLIAMNKERRPDPIRFKILELIIARNRQTQTANMSKLIAEAKQVRLLEIEDLVVRQQQEKELKRAIKAATEKMNKLAYEFQDNVYELTHTQ